jgi:hypothetical protein
MSINNIHLHHLMPVLKNVFCVCSVRCSTSADGICLQLQGECGAYAAVPMPLACLYLDA